jgi:hypothetical protein
MGDAFVDVTYRGLEVGRRLRIRAFTGAAAYVEVPTPMPVGTQLELATDAGVTIPAVVEVVHEQVGGSERAPGMRVAPRLDDASRAWWAMAIATWPEGVPTSAEVTRPVRRAPPTTIAPATVPASRAGGVTEVIEAPVNPGGMVEVEDEPAAITVPITFPLATVPLAVAMVSDATAPTSIESGPIVDDDTGASQRMPAIDDAARTQLMQTVVPPPDDEPAPDEAKRTTVMAAVDIEAILAAAENGEDDDPDIEVSGASDEDAGKSGAMTAAGAKGKKRAPAKRKKRK